MNRLRHCTLEITVLILASAHLGSSAAARASVDLVVNGDFASSLADWNTGSGLADWSAESALANGTGSARLTAINPTGGTAETVLLQCVPVNPGAHLLYLAIRVPSGQATTGVGYAIAYAYGNTICSGPPVAGGFFTPQIGNNAWSGGWAAVVVPAGAASVSIRLVAKKVEAGGEFDILADRVQLRDGLLFADGLASGTTAQWSAAVP